MWSSDMLFCWVVFVSMLVGQGFRWVVFVSMLVGQRFRRVVFVSVMLGQLLEILLGRWNWIDGPNPRP